MSVYQITGQTVWTPLPGNVTVNASDVVNPINGSTGVTTLRIVNTDANPANINNCVQVSIVNTNTTYFYSGVAGTGGSGANLELDVNVAYDYYSTATPTVGHAGTGYVVNDTITVTGDLIGGATPTNDITFNVDSVSNIGAVKSLTLNGGASPWPQGSSTIQTYVNANSVDYLNLNTQSNEPQGFYVGFSSTSNTNAVYVTPVQVVG